MSLSSWNRTRVEHDRRALRILTEIYWTTRGWRASRLEHPDADYARQAGYLYDTLPLDHDEAVQRARSAVEDIDPVDVGDAFLASLGSRRLELRSALGSYALARVLPTHPFTGQRTCAVCCQLDGTIQQDFGAQNLERYKWGGVRHLDPAYMWFDLFLFARSARPRATDGDRDIFRRILRTVVDAADGARPDHVAHALVGVFPSNTHERRILLEILSFAGVLQPRNQPSFCDGWVDCDMREDPPASWRYPFAWWRSEDGVNQTALRQYFPGVGLIAGLPRR